MKITLFLSLVLCAALLSAKVPPVKGEDLSFPPPRIIRTCCSFGTDLAIAGIPFIRQTDITAVDLVGKHQYMGNKEENNGIIYTRRGGFIDLGHLRDCADWTAYLYNLIESQQQKGGKLVIDLGSEGGAKTLTLNLPTGFNNAHDLAGKIAFDLSLWHEIATWFGSSYIPLIPERYSSFSPEDMYSNLLGVKLGIRALKSPLSYDEAMTELINHTLDSLQAVATLEETYAAMQTVENIWWAKKSLPSKNILILRNMESGNQLVPWLIPSEGVAPSPVVLDAPDPGLSELYELSIKLNLKFPVRSILLPAEGRTITQKDFAHLIEYIEKEEKARKQFSPTATNEPEISGL